MINGGEWIKKKKKDPRDLTLERHSKRLKKKKRQTLMVDFN